MASSPSTVNIKVEDEDGTVRELESQSNNAQIPDSTTYSSSEGGAHGGVARGTHENGVVEVEDEIVELQSNTSDHAPGRNNANGEDDEIIELIRKRRNNAARDQNNIGASSPGSEEADAFARFRGALGSWLELGKLIFETKENIDEAESQTSENNANQGTANAGKDFNWYLPLFRAAQRGDWEEAKKFLEKDEEGTKAIINSFRETALQVAVEAGKSNYFVKKLLDYPMPDEAVLWRNMGGDTALHLAAVVGNLEAVTMLVDRKPELLYILNRKKFLPVHLAAMGCHKETLVYLISKSKEGVENSPFEGHLGAVLLMGVISSEFIDVALKLVQNHPQLATLKDKDDQFALHILSGTDCVFPSGENFNWWQKCCYKRESSLSLAN